MGTLCEDQYTFLTVSHRILLRLRNVSHKSCRENQNTHFVFNNFYKKWYHLWDNVEKYCKAGQATDDCRVHTQCKLDTQGYTYTSTICNTYYFLPQQWLHKHASVLHYTYNVCLVAMYVNIATNVHFRNWLVLRLQVEWKGNYTVRKITQKYYVSAILFQPENKDRAKS
jgi:hypothetical protein